MKLSERLTLLKAGYSRDEINAMIDEDAKIAEEAPEQPEAAPEDSAMLKVMSALANEVKDLKTAVYKQNIANTEQISDKGVQQKAEDILASLLNPPEDRKEK